MTKITFIVHIFSALIKLSRLFTILYFTIQEKLSSNKRSQFKSIKNVWHEACNRDWHHLCHVISTFPDQQLICHRGIVEAIISLRYTEICPGQGQQDIFQGQPSIFQSHQGRLQGQQGRNWQPQQVWENEKSNDDKSDHPSTHN